MERATQRQRVEFEQLLVKHLPDSFGYGESIAFAKRLMRYGATLGRIAETECNSPDYPRFVWQMPEEQRLTAMKRIDERYQRELDRLERKEERICARVEKLCEQFQCKPVFQGDPRGNTLKIQVPDGYTNDWGREGICVPTS